MSKASPLKGARYTTTSLPCCGGIVRAYLAPGTTEGAATRRCTECGRVWAYTIRDVSASLADEFGGAEDGVSVHVIAWNRAEGGRES